MGSIFYIIGRSASGKDKIFRALRDDPELFHFLKALLSEEMVIDHGRPVKEENILDHQMHTEWYRVLPEDAEKMNEAKRSGHRVIAVGTTSCRTLETVADENGVMKAASGETGIFIYPGYRFKEVDALITNFHLPESTLIMLVSAFADREKVLKAYEEAVSMKYRFFSFGDAMFLE